MVCSRCGTELVPGSLICDACGAVVRDAGGAGGSPTPSYVVKPPRTAPAARPAWTGKRAALIAAGAAAACTAVVLLLGFAVGPKWFTGGGGRPSGPEQAVDSFYQALVSGDAQALVSLMDPVSLQELKASLSSAGYRSVEQYMQAFIKQVNPQGDLSMSDLSYRTTITGETATVEVTGGKATYTDARGNQVTETPGSGAGIFNQKQFNLLYLDGTWYIEAGV